ncbi:MAG: hypothetical protein JNL12_06250 [Planctomycetes bacterium]|nr:hypothetical protein [Planctomycetota bacterium]
MNHRQNLVALLLLTAAGCASHGSAPADHPMHAELRVFQDAQRVFRSQNSGTHEFDFEGHGRVTVREITLDGFPGHTYLRCRFHYQNRTSQPVFQAFVSLDVLDPKGRIVSSQSCHCIVPTPMPLARGSYYSDELRTPTYDAHLQPGWSWQIRCHADPAVDDEPLNPPVPEGGVRQSPPMLIKDRNWPYDRR